MSTLSPWARRCLRKIVAGNRFYNGKSNSGSSGAIRSAGGAFSKRGAASEEQYFYKKNRELTKHLKKHFEDQIHFHERQIKTHQEAIKRKREKLRDINK